MVYNKEALSVSIIQPGQLPTVVSISLLPMLDKAQPEMSCSFVWHNVL